MDKLKPGMVLAEAVYNFQGVLMLNAGAQLTVNNIRILKSWGVNKICVEGGAEETRHAKTKGRTAVTTSVKKAMKKRFSDIPKHPVILEVMRVSADILENRRLMEEDQNEAG